MSEIADFLRARYAEQRVIAEAAAEHAGTRDWRYRPGSDHVAAVQSFPNDVPARRELWTPLVTEAGSYIGDTIDDEIGNHIAAHDPAAVIADLDAKLAIVDLCATFLHDDDRGIDPCAEGTLCLLAQPFAGHSGHRGEEWAP
ncbi:DUF6221 family protein [Streptomyces bauhiniae]|uniref:DUF6221 family protein n=1 Tax=Streptomyces bauhiniae TaxID=2340725 RepID=UPI0033B3D2EB